jgi:hypothetical protein
VIQDRLLVAVIFLLGALLAYSHAHYLAACFFGGLVCGMADGIIRDLRGGHGTH